MQNKRKKLTVPQEFWSRFILAPIFLIILFFNLALLANLKFFSLTIWEVIEPEAIIIIGVSEIILAGWLIISGRITTHRIAGPTIALKKALNKVGDGNLTVILRFRKRDFNQDIPECFNENIEKIRQQIMEVKQLGQQLSEEIPSNHQSYKTVEKLNDQLDRFSTQVELPQNKRFNYSVLR